LSTSFAAGDACLLVDARGRTYLIELEPGRDFQYHRGALAHDELIGSDDGSRHVSSLGSELLALRPRLAEYTEKMGRGATIVYPKDAAAIVMWADVSPGAVVVEAGTGSGGLTMSLARAVDPGGRVISYERRDDHANRARRLIRGYFGEIPAHVDLHIGEVEEHIVEHEPDRVVLDVPEPWHSVDPAAQGLGAGGIFCCYLPTVPQVQTVRSALSDSAAFARIETFEVMVRDWVIEGRSVRPSHRMVGHTGFITVAKKVTPRRSD
jgi:tRNA (adenine57-N1/adenine58-N1)-methyltransferase